MLNYRSSHWEESARDRGGFQSLLFSAPDHFDMAKGVNRRLHVASADFPVIGTSLLSVTSSGHEIDLADSRFVTIMIPTRGRTHVRMDRRQSSIPEGSALALGPSERWTRVERGAHGDFRANLAKITVASALKWQAMPVVPGDPVLPTSLAALTGLRALIQYLFSDLASPAPTLIRRPASDLFAALVVEHIRMMFLPAGEDLRHQRPQRSLVRRAEEFMAANLSEPVTVPMIAEATGVSVRQLQDAFRRTMGQTPWERLTARRMETARQKLLAGGGSSVTGIALDCGFSHLGRFAQTYRAMFGEAPSVTLRRARTTAGAFRTDGSQNG